MFSLEDTMVAVVGLGYVGLPLAIEFSKRFPTIGYDTNINRVAELNNGIDTTLECSTEELKYLKNLKLTVNLDDLKQCNFYIVAIPTPIDKYKTPNLIPLINAFESIGKIIKPKDVVVFESTVYPGATEEECVPIIERVSALKYNKDFFVGYSPERINPGDKDHSLTKIVKITSGSTAEVADYVDSVYQQIITAGTYKVSSIKVAEAAKVIENSQRDINIAFVNELAVLFNKMGIDTEEVLRAAGTKWNFLPFSPGLVGGHCIGVDPYYLTYKAQSMGYKPEVILAGRRINDSMGEFVASQLVKAMLKKGIQVKSSNALLMGLTFKENCPDLRNTRVVDIISELKEYNINVDVYDPWCSEDEALREYGINIFKNKPQKKYDGIMITVGHDIFKEMSVEEIKVLRKEISVIYDLKYILPKSAVDIRL